MEVQLNRINIYFNLSVLPNLLQKLLKGKPTWSTAKKLREVSRTANEKETGLSWDEVYVSKKENFLLKVLISMFLAQNT